MLVTKGAFGDTTPQMDQYAVRLKSMGVALGNAPKHKLVFIYPARGADNYPARGADKFLELYQGRGETRARGT